MLTRDHLNANALVQNGLGGERELLVISDLDVPVVCVCVCAPGCDPEGVPTHGTCPHPMRAAPHVHGVWCLV